MSKQAGQDHGGSTPKQNDLRHQLQSAGSRAQALSDRITASADQNDVALEAAEELRSTVEELLIADEELRQQNDELLTTRAQLEAERRNYEDLFESAPVGYLVTNKSGIIRKANRAACELLALSPSFVEGKSFIMYVAEKDRPAFREEQRRLSTSQSLTPGTLDLQICPRKVDPFEAELRVSPIKNREGDVVEVRWTLRDITEMKQASEKIKQLNTRLEERVRERTAELEQTNKLKDELLKSEHLARAEAEAASRSKDEFLAIVSHELRTPLNAILGWAQLMRQEVADSYRVCHAAEVIERSARIQSGLINDILDVSRVVSGGLTLDKVPLNLDRVIESAVEDIRPSIESQGIALKLMIKGDSNVIVADPNRLQQMVGNLLSNSAKFTPRGGSIVVNLENHADHSRIEVNDTGEGISPEFLPHVFDRFRQGNSQKTRQHGGLGLGLAIVKILAELHGGTVNASSGGPGQGSTFSITLPASPLRKADLEGSRHEHRSGNRASIVSAVGSLWIVVVDDDFDSREMMKVVLESFGARVTTCGSYEELLSLLDGHGTAALSPRLPDALVADIAMPGLDGFDTIRAVRRLEPARGGQIPAIALTAYADEETRRRALEAGYQKHLTKPLILEELVNAIVSVATSV